MANPGQPVKKNSSERDKHNKFKKLYIDQIALLNKCFKEAKLDFCFDYKPSVKFFLSDDIAIKKDDFDYAASGFMSKAQIHTLTDMVAALIIKNSYKKFLLLMPTQSGKTAVQMNLAILLPPIMSLYTGKPCIFFVNTPSETGLVLQAKKELKNCYDLNERLIIKHKQKSYKISDYFLIPGENAPLPIPKNEDRQHLIVEKLLFARANSKKLIESIDLMNWHANQGHTVFSCMDECHWGQGISGVADQLESSLSSKIITLGCSATPSEYTARPDKYKIVIGYVEKGYCGNLKIHGHEIKSLDGYKPIKPKIYNFNEYFPELNLDTGYIKKDSFYRKSIVNDLARLITKVQRLNKNTSGIFIRTALTNKFTDEICDELIKSVGKNCEIIRYYGENNKKFSIKEACKNNSNGKFFVLVVTGKARMGGALPRDLTFGVDLTKDPSTFNSELQGTCGRVTGYKENSCIVVSPAFKESLEEYIENDCQIINFKTGERLKKDNCTRTTFKVTDDTMNHSVYNEEHLSNKYITKTFEKLTCALNQYNYGNLKSLEFRSKFIEAYCKIINNKFLIRLEKELKNDDVEFLKWGQNDFWLPNAKLSHRINLRRVEHKEDQKDINRNGSAKHDELNIINQIIYRIKPEDKCTICKNIITPKLLDNNDCCKKQAIYEVIGITLRLNKPRSLFKDKKQKVLVPHKNKQNSRHYGN